LVLQLRAVAAEAEAEADLQQLRVLRREVVAVAVLRVFLEEPWVLYKLELRRWVICSAARQLQPQQMKIYQLLLLPRQQLQP
jgi:hypothetical protein